MDDIAAFNLICEVFGDDVFVVCWDGVWFVEYVPPKEEECRNDGSDS